MSNKFNLCIAKMFILMLMIFTSNGCNYDKDVIAPVVEIINPTTAYEGIILIDYNVSDNESSSDDLIIEIECNKDGKTIEVVDNKFEAVEGIYTVTVFATDKDNNVGKDTINITVIKETLENKDIENPIVTIDIPSIVYVGQEFNIEYSVSDNESLEEEITVDVVVYKDDEEVSTIDSSFIVEQGQYKISITATDKAGNSITKEKTFISQVDDIGPEINVQEFNEANVGDEIELNYNISDNVSALEDINIEMLLTRNNKTRNVLDKFKVIEQGHYELTIRATDKQGNKQEKKINFEVSKSREDRKLDVSRTIPSNKTTLDAFINANEEDVIMFEQNYIMKSSSYNVVFIKSTSGYYVDFINAQTENRMFTMPEPISMYFKGSKQVNALYSNVEITKHGIKASGTIQSSKGSSLLINDYYYYPDNDSVIDAINIQREIQVLEGKNSDYGYQSIFAILTVDNNPSNLDWFIPSNIFGDFDHSSQHYKLYRETLCGLPMVLFRDKTNGNSISLSRYKPVIDYESNSYACVGAFYGKNSINDDASSIELYYPTRDVSRKYFDIGKDKQIVYDVSIMANVTSSFNDAYVEFYTKQFLLEDVRIVNTDIDEVYKVINEDFKTLYTTKTNKGLQSYGIPVPITIENGILHGCSWQAGFTGQQLACAYNMMLYGIMHNDDVSLQNGIKLINFWVNDIDMVNDVGVPRTWFEGYYMEWLGYPAFTRMVIDAMEALFDAYRLATAHNIEVSGWIESVTKCADWLVKTQNSDGSWYRCYNYQGEYYKGNEPDITWNPGDVAKPTSKNNTPMPVRFLGKMYEHTHNTKYLDSIKKAGEFIYKDLYPQHVYIGGTCDNADCIDKEAGVFAMYAYDTLYTLTQEQRWLNCLKQATIFTMSTVISFSFKVTENCSTLKAAYPLKCGYSDGLSYITCNGTAVDNYAAYIYYELFRLYVYTGEKVYYKMSEFIQQNTKSTMDWDGSFNYPYKSLVAEASTIYSFSYSAAVDQYGTQGIWLPWQSIANGEPIVKMLDTFNVSDVQNLKDVPLEQLKEVLENYGVGGKQHRKFN